MDFKTLEDFKKKAVDELMDESSKIYFSAGAGSKTTPPHNEEAFQRYFIRPRMLRNVSNGHLRCPLLGQEWVESPIGVSPTAMHSLAHPDGELATAAGSCAEDSIYVVSKYSTNCFEDIVRHAPDGKRWLQLYSHTDREINLDFIKRAEKCGFRALVITVDLPVSGLWRDLFPQASTQSEHFKKLNLPPTPRRHLTRTVTFDEFQWFKENTKLPLIAKGILSGEDAAKAVEAGASAVWVSNHGGRLIERVIPTIHVLEEVVKAVGDDVDVYLDGGVRSGSDAFVALALGAKAVFIGRPIIWGLCCDGEEGVKRVLRILKDQLLATMQLAGAAKVQDIERSMVERIV